MEKACPAPSANTGAATSVFIFSKKNGKGVPSPKRQYWRRHVSFYFFQKKWKRRAQPQAPILAPPRQFLFFPKKMEKACPAPSANTGAATSVFIFSKKNGK